MSDANLASLAFVLESTLGENSSRQLQEIRFTGESFAFQKETVASAEIRSDRQVSDTQKVFGQPAGGFDFELSFAFILPFLTAAMQSDFISKTNAAISTAINHAASTLTAAPGTFTGLPVGAIVMVSGATTPGNNGPKRVNGVNPDGSICQCAPGSFTVSETMPLTTRWNTISNGTSRKSMTVEKRLVNPNTGLAFFQEYKGLVADTLEVKIESKKLITGSLGFVGTTYALGSVSEDSTAVTGTAATGILSFAALPQSNDQVRIAGRTYRMRTTLAGSVANDVLIAADIAGTVDNLIQAINATTGAGTKYNALTTAHPEVTAGALGGAGLQIYAIQIGLVGNLIQTDVPTGGARMSFAAATLLGGTTPAAGYDAPASGAIMNGTNNVGTIRMNGQVATDRFKGITLQIANNVRGKDACGVEGNFDIGLGQVSVKGMLDAYFQDNALPTRIKDHTTFSLEFSVRDEDGNQLFFFLPSVKPADGDPAITAINTDVMLKTNFEAIKGKTAQNATNKTLIIDAITVL